MTARPVLATVGGNPLPVLESLLALRPPRLVLLASPQSTGQARAVERALRALSGAPGPAEVAHRGAEAWDPPAIRRAVEQAVAGWEGPWDLAYSGGTPAMAAEAFLVWREQPGAAAGGEGSPAAWYVDDRRRGLVALDGGRRPLPRVPSNPAAWEQVLRLHGWTPSGGHRTACSVDPRSDGRQLARLDPRAPRRERDRRNAEAAALAGGLLAAAADRVGACVVVGGSAGRPGADGVDLPISWLDGLALVLVDVAGYRDDGRGSATLAWPVGRAKERLFDLERRASLVGGSHARTLLVLLGRDAGEVRAALMADHGPQGAALGPLDPAHPARYAVATCADLADLAGPGTPALLAWLCGVP